MALLEPGISTQHSGYPSTLCSSAFPCSPQPRWQFESHRCGTLGMRGAATGRVYANCNHSSRTTTPVDARDARSPPCDIGRKSYVCAHHATTDWVSSSRRQTSWMSNSQLACLHAINRVGTSTITRAKFLYKRLLMAFVCPLAPAAIARLPILQHKSLAPALRTTTLTALIGFLLVQKTVRW